MSTQAVEGTTGGGSWGKERGNVRIIFSQIIGFYGQRPQDVMWKSLQYPDKEGRIWIPTIKKAPTA